MLKALSVVLLTFILLTNIYGGYNFSERWKFGIMGDTQWKENLDGENPNTVAGGIIRQINRKFIEEKVAFVIQVGDLCDLYSNSAFNTRADLAAELINEGIGFFPLRGNHESSQAAANYFNTVFPQTTGSVNTFGATNFTSPFPSLGGLSYSFYYNNACFVLLDQFRRKDGSGNTNTNIIDQIPWIDSIFRSKPENYHGFIFAHKNLIGQNHTDALFGTNPASNVVAQNSFIAATSENNVRFFFSGHDHMHNRSLVFNSRLSSYIQQIICSSNSYKFYTPVVPALDITYNNPPREIPVAQELYTVGYYIVDVDGPNITVTHYASLNGCGGDWERGGIPCDLKTTPSLSFVKRETWGYSLEGKEFLLSQGESFTIVKDTIEIGNGYSGACMELIYGINNYTGNTYDGRKTTRLVNTGWSPKRDDLCSDILYLWGMENGCGKDTGDLFTLSITYNESETVPLVIAIQNKNGEWENAAVSTNPNNKKFIIGSFKAENFKAGF